MLDNTASSQIYNSQWLNSSVVVNCGESHTQCGLATCAALHHLSCLYLSHEISKRDTNCLCYCLLALDRYILSYLGNPNFKEWEYEITLAHLENCQLDMDASLSLVSQMAGNSSQCVAPHCFLFHNCALSTASANKFSQFFITQGFLSFFHPFNNRFEGHIFKQRLRKDMTGDVWCRRRLPRVPLWNCCCPLPPPFHFSNLFAAFNILWYQQSTGSPCNLYDVKANRFVKARIAAAVFPVDFKQAGLMSHSDRIKVTHCQITTQRIS